MKTKLDPQEKARRQNWRNVRYAMPAVHHKHHFTRKERLGIEDSVIHPLTRKPMSPATLTAMMTMGALLGPDTK